MDEIFAYFKKTSKVRTIMLVVSILILIIAYVSIKNTENNFNNNAAETTAVIIGYTQYDYPILSYVVEGQEYKTNSKIQLPDYQIGDKVVIRYHREDPSFILTEGESITPLW